MPDCTRLSGVRRIGVSLVVAALALAGCGESTGTGPATEAGSPTAETGDRTVAVYAAVVRQLVTKDHTFEDEETPFERVFIDVHVDATGDPNAPGAHTPMGTRLSAEEQAAILRELVDLPRVEFVEDPDSVVVNEGDCAQVIKGNGALVTLGPISGDAERVTVPNDMFPGCLGGVWLTYVLERTEGGWRVTGTEGPIVIS